MVSRREVLLSDPTAAVRDGGRRERSAHYGGGAAASGRQFKREGTMPWIRVLTALLIVTIAAGCSILRGADELR